jgi:hypothetical protein
MDGRPAQDTDVKQAQVDPGVPRKGWRPRLGSNTLLVSWPHRRHLGQMIRRAVKTRFAASFLTMRLDLSQEVTVDKSAFHPVMADHWCNRLFTTVIG